MTCIITGCALTLSDDTSRYAWGDLHMFEDCFVFNASTDSSGGVNWGAILPSCAKVVNIPIDVNYFERRGVFVMPGLYRLLNKEATKYVSRST